MANTQTAMSRIRNMPSPWMNRPKPNTEMVRPPACLALPSNALSIPLSMPYQHEVDTVIKTFLLLSRARPRTKKPSVKASLAMWLNAITKPGPIKTSLVISATGAVNGKVTASTNKDHTEMVSVGSGPPVTKHIPFWQRMAANRPFPWGRCDKA